MDEEREMSLLTTNKLRVQSLQDREVTTADQLASTSLSAGEDTPENVGQSQASALGLLRPTGAVAPQP